MNIKKGTLVLEYCRNNLYRIHLILGSYEMLGVSGTHKRLEVSTKHFPSCKQIKINASYNELFTNDNIFKYKFIQPINKT